MAFAPDAKGTAFGGWLNQLIARPSFQEMVSRLPVLRWIARRDGAELFELVQGFVRSQVLFALVELEIPDRLLKGPASTDMLSIAVGMSQDKLRILLQAGVGVGLLKRRRDDRYALTRKGAALVGVPGLKEMVLHHKAFYGDMADPVALLEGGVETELAGFWPYVFGATGDVDPGITRTYSELMASSQKMVAQDTLATISLKGVQHLLDIGGGSGEFLTQVAGRFPKLELTLFDLPEVMPAAAERLTACGMDARIKRVGGSFRADPLPKGADAISLIRVLYDHDDSSVSSLLMKVFDALPPGGLLLISEPMSGGSKPDPVTDVYFAFYTLAMRTGRTRSANTIREVCEYVGFEDVICHKSRRSYVTSVVTARKPA